MTTAREVHPVADIFPLMMGKAFDDLVLDIRANGLREPIWIHRDGRILDGRNRYRACQTSDIEPAWRLWDGDDGGLVSFILSLNLHRRHLNEAQRAAVAAKIATLPRGTHPHSADVQICTSTLTQLQAAGLLNISPRSVKAARHVLDFGIPDLVSAVEGGEVAVNAAAVVADLPREVQQRIIAGGRTAVRAAANRARPLGDRAKDAAGVKKEREEGVEPGRLDKSREGTRRRHERMREMAKAGYSVSQMAEAVGLTEAGCRAVVNHLGIHVPASEAIGKTHRHDPNRIISRMVEDARNLTADLNLIQYASIDSANLAQWITELGEAVSALRGFVKRLQKEQERYVQAA